MDDLLSAIYIKEGYELRDASFEVTLAQMLVEQQVQAEWRPARPDGAYESPYLRLFPVVPFDEIAALAAAWQRLVSAAAERGLMLRISASSHGAPPQQLQP